MQVHPKSHPTLEMNAKNMLGIFILISQIYIVLNCIRVFTIYNIHFHPKIINKMAKSVAQNSTSGYTLKGCTCNYCFFLWIMTEVNFIEMSKISDISRSWKFHPHIHNPELKEKTKSLYSWRRRRQRWDQYLLLNW